MYYSHVNVNQKLKLINQVFSPNISERAQDFKLFPSFAVNLDLYNELKVRVSDSELENLFRLSRLIFETDVDVTSNAVQLVEKAWSVLHTFYHLEEEKVYSNISEFTKKTFFSKLLGKK
jgi:hypothetical protein